MLRKKMWRDLWENKAAYIACIAVIAIGLMVFTSVSVVFESLVGARDNFYQDYRFADGFVRVRGISESGVDRLEDVSGIEALDGRLVKDARVLFPGREENVYLRLVSVRPGDSRRLNDVHVLEGELPAERVRAVMLDPAFAAANGLAVGDNVPVVIGGKRVELKVSGTGQSPEFVYAMRTTMEVYPDPEVFGIGFMSLDVMKTLFQEESLNDLVFSLESGYEYDDVEERLKARLVPFGLEAIYPREDQLSEVILDQELTGLESTVSAMPMLFLAIAALILYILLKRMVEQQRGQIGTLKAFGFSKGSILFHYVSYALTIGVVGGLLGGLLGVWLSYPMTELYKMFFNLPGLSSTFSVKYLVIGVLLSLVFSALAGYFGSKDALKLQPAEAMRPPAPPPAKQTLLEKWKLYWAALTVQGKMATRNLFRSKARSFFTLLGVMFAFSLIATTGYFASLTDVLMVDQFTKVQAHDVKIVFQSPLPARRVQREAMREPGVKRAEPYLEVPANMHYKGNERGTVILGLEDGSELYHILTEDEKKLQPPKDGILLSGRLAELLGAEVGSRLEVESPYAVEDVLTVDVVGIIPQYLGSNAYMEIGALGRLLPQGDVATSLLLSVEESAIPRLRDRYNESGSVFAVEEKAAALKKFDEMMESFGFMIYIMALFGMFTGFAVIYNAGIVSLSERKRELASLRVMGMSPGEVLQVLTFEQWFISVFGILAGVPMTLALIAGMASSVDNDLFTFPVRFELQPMIVGALGTIVSIWFTHLVMARKVRQLSMVEVLKERD